MTEPPLGLHDAQALLVMPPPGPDPARETGQSLGSGTRGRGALMWQGNRSRVARIGLVWLNETLYVAGP
jgi:hypothetical protein